MQSEESFSQLQLRFSDPIQYDYELIRPVVLHSKPIAERSRETEIARTTVNDKAKRFAIEGMLGLVDKRSRPKASEATILRKIDCEFNSITKQNYHSISLLPIKTGEFRQNDLDKE